MSNTNHNIKQKAASSMVWTALQKYSTMGIQFLSGIILARLLTPYDYGCIGMLSIFLVLAESFIDGGFGSALIQKKQPTQEDYSTIFWWNIGMAAFMYILLFFSAPLVANFYDIPLLSSVLRVQGIILFIYALNIVQRNQLKKRLNFKVLSIVTISTSLIAFFVTVFLAYKGFGVWALVVQQIVVAAIPAIVFWFFIKWRPIFVFSKKSFKELFSFGFYMFLSHLINTFSMHLQGLLIGKVYNASTMGYYSKAHGTEKLASYSISSVMTQVTYPLYAAVQDKKAVMISMIRRMIMTLSFFSFPMMFILILLAEPIFVLLYSDKWINSVPYFQALCLAGLPNCLQSVNMQSISAIGKSKIMFKWTIIKRAVGVSAVVIGLALFGMKGLLGGLLINSWFAYFVHVGLVSKHLGYNWKDQLKDLMPVAFVSLIAAIVSFLSGYFLNWGMYQKGALVLVVYLIIYVGWSLVFKPEAYTYSLTIIPSKFRFWEKKVNQDK